MLLRNLARTKHIKRCHLILSPTNWLDYRENTFSNDFVRQGLQVVKFSIKVNFLLHENSIQPVGLSPMTRLVTHWLLAVRDRHQTPFYRNPREGGWLGTTTTRLGFATTLSIFLFLCGWVYTGMSFVCFILFWNTLFLCSDIVYKTKDFQLFKIQNSNL